MLSVAPSRSPIELTGNGEGSGSLASPWRAVEQQVWELQGGKAVFRQCSDDCKTGEQ